MKFSAALLASSLFTLSHALPADLPATVAKVGDKPDVELFSKRSLEERQEVVANPKVRANWRSTTTTTTPARTRPGWRATTTTQSFFIAPTSATTTPVSSSSSRPAFVPAPVPTTTTTVPVVVPATSASPTSTTIPAIATVSSVVPTTTTTTAAAAASPSTAALAEALTEHNRFRALHGAAPLVWDQTLANAAATWASKCVFQHSQGAVGPYGENLAASAGTGLSVTPSLVDALIKLWEDEAADYTPATPNYSHFTQMVWKSSTKLGCALQVCTPGSLFDAAYGSGFYLVCEYDPAGNVYPASNFLANVQP